jgi:hypothetical protein
MRVLSGQACVTDLWNCGRGEGHGRGLLGKGSGIPFLSGNGIYTISMCEEKEGNKVEGKNRAFILSANGRTNRQAAAEAIP